MTVWEELVGSRGWQALTDRLRTEVDGLRGNLLGLAVKSSDPEVRALANRIRAIEDLLSLPEREINRGKEAEE